MYKILFFFMCFCMVSCGPSSNTAKTHQNTERFSVTDGPAIYKDGSLQANVYIMKDFKNDTETIIVIAVHNFNPVAIK